MSLFDTPQNKKKSTGDTVTGSPLFNYNPLLLSDSVLTDEQYRNTFNPPATKQRSPFENIKTNDVTNGIQYGLLGLDYALSANENRRENQNFNNRLRNTFSQKPINDYNYMYGQGTNGGSEFQPIIKAEEGVITKTNGPIELEGGEVVQLPDFSIEHVKGPKHKFGGVDTTLPKGAKVFSNKLKAKDSKKTFAELAKQLDITKEKELVDNTFAHKADRNTAAIHLKRKQAKLDALFAEQQEMNDNNSTDESSTFPDGGVIKNSVNLPKQKNQINWWENESVDPLKGRDVYKNMSPSEKILNSTENIPGINLPKMPEQQKPLTAQEKLQSLVNGNKPPYPDNAATLSQKRDRLRQVLNNYGKKLGYDSGIDDFKNLSQTDMNAAAGKFQEYLSKNHPDVVKNYMNFTDPTNKGRSNSSDPMKGFKDDLWWYRAPMFEDVQFDNEKDYQDFVTKNSTKSNVNGKDYYQYKDNPDYFINPVFKENAPSEPVSKQPTVTKPVAPMGEEFTPASKFHQTPSSMANFPLYQALPELSGFLAAMNPYSYYTPDYTHWEVSPSTLNIQPQLDSINSSFQTGIKQNTGNASVNNSRNTAMFNQALQAKQQAFGNKQNYDAQNRFQADQLNMNARTQENMLDLNAAEKVYNNYRSVAMDNAGTEKMNAISSLTNKTANYYQDEYRKMLYFDTILDNYYYDGKDKKNPVKLDPNYEETIKVRTV